MITWAGRRVQRFKEGPRAGEIRRDNHGRPLREPIPGTERYVRGRHEPLVSARQFVGGAPPTAVAGEAAHPAPHRAEMVGRGVDQVRRLWPLPRLPRRGPPLDATTSAARALMPDTMSSSTVAAKPSTSYV